MASIADRIGAAVKALRATPSALEALSVMGGRYFAYPRSAYVDGAFLEMSNATYANIYATQENVRIVVDAISRSAAKRSLKCYKRDSAGKKTEDGNFIAMETIRTPNDFQSEKELLNYLVHDKLVYDDAFLWDMGSDVDGRRFLLRVPPFAMGVSSNNKLHPQGYRVFFQDGTYLDLTPDEVIHWRGYSADNNRIGTSPLETLRNLLLESATRKARIVELTRSGLVKGGIVTRPLEAPEWSAKARERFQESFGGRLRETQTGGVALLEDGMEFVEAGITPREAEILDTRQFELGLVANIYGINPSLFSVEGNLAAAREMLDEDVVDPLLASLTAALTHQLIRETYQDDLHFFRFRPAPITDLNLLFEASSKATGGSVLTPNEFREDYLDKPPVDGGDEIVSHPGSQEGSIPAKPQSNPRGRPPTPEEDVGKAEEDIRRFIRESQIEREAVEAKSLIAQKDFDRRLQVMAIGQSTIFRRHFQRQAKAHEAGQWPWLNQERWNKELAKDLLDSALEEVEQEGTVQAKAKGGQFDVDFVRNYLTVGARELAKGINDTTYRNVKKGDDVTYYRESAGGRAKKLGENRAAQLMEFAAEEAGKQLGGEHALAHS